VPPRISQNFLSMDSEWDLLRDAVRMAREIASRQPIRNFVDREMTFPHASKNTTDELDEQIRQTAATVNHPLGTCKAGIASDDMAVVDEDLRVMGLSNLRVVDASVMPDLVGGNINAAVTMIAERASDVIRGRVH
jgi:choline dehydrogenase-like flavoprotein